MLEQETKAKEKIEFSIPRGSVPTVYQSTPAVRRTVSANAVFSFITMVVALVHTATLVTPMVLSAVTILIASRGQSAVQAPTYTFTPLTLYFMSPTGNDANTGLSPAQAWLSPNHSVNCGDVILANSGTYDSNNLQSWGHVSNCPSTSGGIDGAGGIYFATILCAGASVGDCIVNDNHAGFAAFEMTHSSWAVEGWSCSTLPTSTVQAFCFLPDGRIGVGETTVVHHFAFLNNITTNSASGYADADGGTNIGVHPGNGVDHWYVVGNIAQDSNSINLCTAAIVMGGPADSGVSPTTGTRVFVAGNFVINNQQKFGTCTSDGEGMMFDTWDAHGYTGQGIMSDNVLFGCTERYGIQLFFQNEITPYNNPAPMKVYNNTIQTVSCQNNTTNAFVLGHINISTGGTANWPWATTIFNNISLTQSATNVVGTDLYALIVSFANQNVTIGGTGLENIFKGHMTSCALTFCDAGFNTAADFSVGILGTNTYIDPSFKNAGDLSNHTGTPNCSGFETVVACMGFNWATQTASSLSVIDDLTPTAGGTSGKGYQPPPTNCLTSGQRFNDYPVSLKGMNYLHSVNGWTLGTTILEKPGLSAKPCGM